MAQGQTKTAGTAAGGAPGHRRRGRRAARRLAVVAAALATLGLLIGIALGARNVLIASIAELAVVVGLLAAVTNPLVNRYVVRNLPAGGMLLLATMLGLLVAGLLEAAAPDSGRPLLLVLIGEGGLLAGAIAAWLLDNRFRAGLDERGFAGAGRLRWFDVSSGEFRRLLARSEVVIISMLGLIVIAVLWGELGSATTTATTGLAFAFTVGAAAVGGAQVATVVMAGRGSARTRQRIAGGVADLGPELLVHFSGGIATLYQLAHWIPAVAATGRPWLIVFREPATFAAASDMEQAVLVEDYGDLDLVISSSVRAVLYVNTATKNNHAVRFEAPVHVQLHHGDSDKPPSSGKTIRLYDVHFVAGKAARTRLEAAGVASERIFEVGRPVTDSLAAAGETPSTVLYAPTWEGAHADSNLSSLERQGEQIVRSLAASGRPFIFRPHPLSGTADGAAAVARRRVAELAEALGGTVDPGRDELVAAFGAAGLLVCDVSSVLVDWYATGRPVLVTDVAGLGENEVWRRYPTTRGAGVVDASSADLESLVAEAFGSDRMQQERVRAAASMLGEVGRAQERFDAALTAVIRPR